MTKEHDDNADHWDVFDGMGPSYGRLLVERLLLSLIDAHPREQVRNLPEHIRRDRERRLTVAMKALFNETTSPKLPDHAALRWMAEQYVRDQIMGSVRGEFQTPNVEPRSERQLAQEASEKFYSEITDKSERLRKKWREQREFWLAVVRYSDDVLESIETQVLAKIWIALAQAHVPVLPNWPDGRSMSEEQMIRTGLPAFAELVEFLRRASKRPPRV